MTILSYVYQPYSSLSLFAFKLRKVYKGLFHQLPLSVLDFLWLFTTSLIILCEYKIQKKLVYIFICGEISQSSLWMFHFLLVFSGVSLIYGELFCCSLEAFFLLSDALLLSS